MADRHDNLYVFIEFSTPRLTDVIICQNVTDYNMDD